MSFKLFIMTSFSSLFSFTLEHNSIKNKNKKTCCNVQHYCLDTHQSCWTVGVVGECYDPEAVVSWLGWPLPSCALLLHEGTPGNKEDSQLRNLHLNHTLFCRFPFPSLLTSHFHHFPCQMRNFLRNALQHTKFESGDGGQGGLVVTMGVGWGGDL